MKRQLHGCLFFDSYSGGVLYLKSPRFFVEYFYQKNKQNRPASGNTIYEGLCLPERTFQCRSQVV